jgi:hypothetical protein
VPLPDSSRDCLFRHGRPRSAVDGQRRCLVSSNLVSVVGSVEPGPFPLKAPSSEWVAVVEACPACILAPRERRPRCDGRQQRYPRRAGANYGEAEPDNMHEAEP